MRLLASESRSPTNDPGCHWQDWLYEDGEDETKAVYIAKLEELRKQAEPIASRAREAEARGPAAGALTNAAQHYLQLVESNKPEHSHIPQADKDKVGRAPDPFFSASA